MKMNTWQPIETAPKDGDREIFLMEYEKGWPDGCFAVAIWKDDHWQEMNGGSMLDRPTHWMPIPVPPASPNP